MSRPPARSPHVYQSAPSIEERPLRRDRCVEVNAFGWDYLVEIDETGGIAWTALIWGNPENPADWRVVPIVTGGALRREIEWAVGWVRDFNKCDE